METENTSPNITSNNMLVPLIIGALILVAAFAIYSFRSSNNQNTEEIAQRPEESEPTSTPTPSPTPTNNIETDISTTESDYRDGTYNVTGNYISPGGPREIDLSLTITNGQVADSVFVGKAEDPTSIRFQKEFADNYKPMIVGKSLDEINLTKVSGSSLTPLGFKDALEKIKAEASV